MSEPDRGRMLRRRHKHERQAVIFGVLVAALAVAGLASAAVFTGRINIGLFDRDFSETPVVTPTLDPYPCPPTGALPVAYGEIVVNVLNGTAQVGLAGDTAESLRSRGFGIGVAANGPRYDEIAQVAFGSSGVAAAYTLAAQLEGAVLAYDTRADATVDLILGSKFIALVPADQVTLDPAQPLPAPSSCVPFDQITPTAAPPAGSLPAGTDPAGDPGTDPGTDPAGGQPAGDAPAG